MNEISKKGRGRPRKDGRAKQEVRDRLIRRGIEILTEKGYASTGLDEILKSEGVPKGSFYYYFSSKDEYGEAVIDGYASYFAHRLDQVLLPADVPPLERIGNFVNRAIEWMEKHDFRRGCLIGNMGQELSSTHDQFRDRLEAVFQDWQGRIAQCLELAKDAGDLAPDADSANLAAFFWIGWEGAVLRAKLVRSPDPMRLFADTFFAGLPKAD